MPDRQERPNRPQRPSYNRGDLPESGHSSSYYPLSSSRGIQRTPTNRTTSASSSPRSGSTQPGKKTKPQKRITFFGCIVRIIVLLGVCIGMYVGFNMAKDRIFSTPKCDGNICHIPSGYALVIQTEKGQSQLIALFSDEKDLHCWQAQAGHVLSPTYEGPSLIVLAEDPSAEHPRKDGSWALIAANGAISLSIHPVGDIDGIVKDYQHSHPNITPVLQRNYTLTTCKNDSAK